MKQQFTCDSGHKLTFEVIFEGDKARLETMTDANFSCPDCLALFQEVLEDLMLKAEETGIEVKDERTASRSRMLGRICVDKTQGGAK